MGVECIGVCAGPSIKYGSSLFLAARRIQLDRLVCLDDFFAADTEVVGDGVSEDEGKVAGTNVVDIRGTEFVGGSADVPVEACGVVPFLQSQWQVIQYLSAWWSTFWE